MTMTKIPSRKTCYAYGHGPLKVLFQGNLVLFPEKEKEGESKRFSQTSGKQTSYSRASSPLSGLHCWEMSCHQHRPHLRPVILRPVLRTFCHFTVRIFRVSAFCCSRSPSGHQRVEKGQENRGSRKRLLFTPF